MRRGGLILAVGGLLALAGCGGDDTETTTVTSTEPATTTSTTEPTATTADEVEDCTSKSEPNITDLSVRNMSCEEADALTADVVQSLSRQPFSAAGFDCEILGQSGPDSGPVLGAEDIRCTSGDQAFRFSFGD